MEKQLSYQSSGWLQKVSVMVSFLRKVMWYVFQVLSSLSTNHKWLYRLVIEFRLVNLK